MRSWTEGTRTRAALGSIRWAEVAYAVAALLFALAVA